MYNELSMMNRVFFLWLVLSAAFAAGAGAQSNVVMVTLDTTRADRMGFLGSKRGLTPHLDTLAREGAVFTRAYAQAPLTTVFHASLLTGSYPLYHTVDGFGVPLPASVLREGHSASTANCLDGPADFRGADETGRRLFRNRPAA